MVESSAIREKRLELSELEAGKDFCDPALYNAMRQALQGDLDELLGAEPAPVEPPARPIRLTTPIKPKPADAELVADPHPTEVLPAVPVEKRSMPKTPPTTLTDPKQVLDHLLARLDKATKRGSKISSICHEIRTHCRLTGLQVPKEAQKKPMGRHKAGQPQTEAYQPARPAAKTEPAHVEFGRKLVVQIADKLAIDPAWIDPTHSSTAAARIRALRSHALEVLPALEDLEPQAALDARVEMDLLAQTLVLGGHLIARRTA